MVAELVKESRKKAHLTQEQFAEKLNVKRTYISKIERASSDVRISTLRKIIEIGRCSIWGRICICQFNRKV